MSLEDFYDDFRWEDGVTPSQGSEETLHRNADGGSMGSVSQEIDGSRTSLTSSLAAPRISRKVTLQDFYDDISWKDMDDVQDIQVVPSDGKDPKPHSDRPAQGQQGTSHGQLLREVHKQCPPQGDAQGFPVRGAEPQQAPQPEHARTLPAAMQGSLRFAVASPPATVGRAVLKGTDSRPGSQDARGAAPGEGPRRPPAPAQRDVGVSTTPACSARSGKDSAVSTHTLPPSSPVDSRVQGTTGFDSISSLDSSATDLRLHRSFSQPLLAHRTPPPSPGSVCRHVVKPVAEWDEQDVVEWISYLSPVPSDFVELLHRHAINGTVLLTLSDEDIKNLGMKFGYQRLLILAARELRTCANRRTEPLLEISEEPNMDCSPTGSRAHGASASTLAGAGGSATAAAHAAAVGGPAALAEVLSPASPSSMQMTPNCTPRMPTRSIQPSAPGQLRHSTSGRYLKSRSLQVLPTVATGATFPMPAVDTAAACQGRDTTQLQSAWNKVRVAAGVAASSPLVVQVPAVASTSQPLTSRTITQCKSTQLPTQGMQPGMLTARPQRRSGSPVVLCHGVHVVPAGGTFLRESTDPARLTGRCRGGSIPEMPQGGPGAPLAAGSRSAMPMQAPVYKQPVPHLRSCMPMNLAQQAPHGALR